MLFMWLQYYVPISQLALAQMVPPPPCKSKVEDEIMDLRPVECVCNLPIKKWFSLINFIDINFHQDMLFVQLQCYVSFSQLAPTQMIPPPSCKSKVEGETMVSRLIGCICNLTKKNRCSLINFVDVIFHQDMLFMQLQYYVSFSQLAFTQMVPPPLVKGKQRVRSRIQDSLGAYVTCQ